MKRAIIISVVLTAAATAGAAQAPVWARVYYESSAAMERDILGAGMDVCSGAAGEYVDVIASAEDLAGLQDMGYRIEVIAEDAGAGIAALPPDLGLYHTYAEMLAELRQRERDYPNICKLYDIGDTWENRDIWALKISDNPGRKEAEAKLYVCGCHHARELMTVEIPLRFVKILLEGYASDPDIKYYVDNYEIYIVPMVNPDGHVYVENNSSGPSYYWWRKNRRDNGGGIYGVDLNRNYGYKWGYDNYGSSPVPSSNIYRGPSAFSEPEATAIRNLMKDTDFLFGLDYHSYGEYVLLPWGYPPANLSHTPEHSFFLELGNGVNTKLRNRYRVGTIPELLYRVNGDSSDYMYGEVTEKKKIYGLGFEVNTRYEGGFAPPESYIDPTCTEQEGVLKWILEYMRKYVGVELTRFEGRASEDGAVLTWATASEFNHAGFNLYRGVVRASDGSSRVKINDELIVGKSPYRFVDAAAEGDASYEYYLEDVDLHGKGTLHGPARVDMKAGSKASFALASCAPNPAHTVTTIAFSVPTACEASLAIYDLAGRKVATAYAGPAEAGENQIEVDVSALAPGVYTYRLEAGGEAAARRMVVVR